MHRLEKAFFGDTLLQLYSFFFFLFCFWFWFCFVERVCACRQSGDSPILSETCRVDKFAGRVFFFCLFFFFFDVWW